MERARRKLAGADRRSRHCRPPEGGQVARPFRGPGGAPPSPARPGPCGAQIRPAEQFSDLPRRAPVSSNGNTAHSQNPMAERAWSRRPRYQSLLRARVAAQQLSAATSPSGSSSTSSAAEGLTFETLVGVIILVIADIVVVDITHAEGHAVFVGYFVNPSELIQPTLLHPRMRLRLNPCSSVFAYTSMA